MFMSVYMSTTCIHVYMYACRYVYIYMINIMIKPCEKNKINLMIQHMMNGICLNKYANCMIKCMIKTQNVIHMMINNEEQYAKCSAKQLRQNI